VEVTKFFGYDSLRKVKALGARFFRNNKVLRSKVVRRYTKTIRASLVYCPLVYFMGDDNWCFNFIIGDMVFDAFIGSAKIKDIYLDKGEEIALRRLKKKKRIYVKK